jgi:hypothetical protein
MLPRLYTPRPTLSGHTRGLLYTMTLTLLPRHQTKIAVLSTRLISITLKEAFSSATRISFSASSPQAVVAGEVAKPL